MPYNVQYISNLNQYLHQNGPVEFSGPTSSWTISKQIELRAMIYIIIKLPIPTWKKAPTYKENEITGVQQLKNISSVFNKLSKYIPNDIWSIVTGTRLNPGWICYKGYRRKNQSQKGVQIQLLYLRPLHYNDYVCIAKTKSIGLSSDLVQQNSVVLQSIYK